MPRGRTTAVFSLSILSVFFLVLSTSFAGAQTASTGSTGGSSSGSSVSSGNKACPDPDATHGYNPAVGYDAAYQDGTVTKRNLYGKSCPTTVQGVSGSVQGECKYADGCEAISFIGPDGKVHTIPAEPTNPSPGGTGGTGGNTTPPVNGTPTTGTEPATGTDAPWKPLPQNPASQVDDAFTNGTKPIDYVSSDYMSPSGNAFNNYLNDQIGGFANTPASSFSGSLFDQVLSPTSGFNSDYLNIGNTSVSFPEPTGMPSGIDSLGPNNFSAPSNFPTDATTGFGAPAGVPSAPADIPSIGGGFSDVPSLSPANSFDTNVPQIPATNPWELPQAPIPSIPTSLPTTPADTLAGLGNSFGPQPTFTPPLDTNWTGANVSAPFSDYMNTGGQFVADAGLGTAASQIGGVASGPGIPTDIRTPQDLATVVSSQPVAFRPGPQLDTAIPASLNGGWINGDTTVATNFGLVSYGNVSWVNGNGNDLWSEYQISTQEGGFVNFGPTPEQLAGQVAQGDQVGDVGGQPAPAVAESVNPGTAPSSSQTFSEWAGKTWEDVKSGQLFSGEAEAKPSADVVTKAAAGETVEGQASGYNPNRSGQASGGQGTATGGTYDPNSYDAAIQTDIGRATNCGVGGGEVCYALVEQGDKSLVVRVNDNGPLSGQVDGKTIKDGRIIDLNQKSMDYFTGTQNSVALLDGVQVTMLEGEHTPGPVDAATAASLKNVDAAPPQTDARSDVSQPLSGGATDARNSLSPDIVPPETTPRVNESSTGVTYDSVRDVNFGGLSTLTAVETGTPLPDITPVENRIPVPEWNPPTGEQVTAEVNAQVQQDVGTTLANLPLPPEPPTGAEITDQLNAQTNQEVNNTLANLPLPDVPEPQLPTQNEALAQLLSAEGQSTAPTVYDEYYDAAGVPKPLTDAEIAARIPVPDTSTYIPSESTDVQVRSIFDQKIKDAQAQVTYAQELLDRSETSLQQGAAQSLLDLSNQRLDAIVDNSISYAAGNPNDDLRKALEASSDESTQFTLLKTGIEQEKAAAKEFFAAMPKTADLATASGWWDLAKMGYYGSAGALYTVDAGLKEGVLAVGKTAGWYTPDQTTAISDAIDPIGSKVNDAIAATNVLLPVGIGARNLAEKGINAGIDTAVSTFGRVAVSDVAGETFSTGLTSVSTIRPASAVDEVVENVTTVASKQPVAITQGGGAATDVAHAAPSPAAPLKDFAQELPAPLSQSQPSSILKTGTGDDFVSTSNSSISQIPEPQMVAKVEAAPPKVSEVPEPVVQETSGAKVVPDDSVQNPSSVKVSEAVDSPTPSTLAPEPSAVPSTAIPQQPVISAADKAAQDLNKALGGDLSVTPAPPNTPSKLTSTLDDINKQIARDKDVADSVSTVAERPSYIPPTEGEPAKIYIYKTPEVPEPAPTSVATIEPTIPSKASPVPDPADWARSPGLKSGVEPTPVKNDLAQQWNAIDELVAQQRAAPAIADSLIPNIPGPITRVMDPIPYPPYSPTQTSGVVPARLGETLPSPVVNGPTAPLSAGQAVTLPVEPKVAPVGAPATAQDVQMQSILKEIAQQNPTPLERSIAGDLGGVRPGLDTTPAPGQAAPTVQPQGASGISLPDTIAKTDTFPSPTTPVNPATRVEGTPTNPAVSEIDVTGFRPPSETPVASEIPTAPKGVLNTYEFPPNVVKEVQPTVRVTSEMPENGVWVDIKNPAGDAKVVVAPGDQIALNNAYNSGADTIRVMVSPEDARQLDIMKSGGGAPPEISVYAPPTQALGSGVRVGEVVPLQVAADKNIGPFRSFVNWTTDYDASLVAKSTGATVSLGALYGGAWAINSISQDLTPVVNVPDTSSGSVPSNAGSSANVDALSGPYTPLTLEQVQKDIGFTPQAVAPAAPVAGEVKAPDTTKAPSPVSCGTPGANAATCIPTGGTDELKKATQPAPQSPPASQTKSPPVPQAPIGPVFNQDTYCIKSVYPMNVQTVSAGTPFPTGSCYNNPNSGSGGVPSGFGAVMGSLAAKLFGTQQSSTQNSQPAPQPKPTTPTPSTPTTTPVASVVSIIANPPTVAAGKTTQLSWSAVGPTQCAVFDANDTQIAAGNPNGTSTTVALTETSIFKVTCTGGAGSANSQVTVTVQ